MSSTIKAVGFEDVKVLENPLDFHPAVNIRFVRTHACGVPGEDENQKFVIPAL